MIWCLESNVYFVRFSRLQKVFTSACHYEFYVYLIEGLKAFQDLRIVPNYQSVPVHSTAVIYCDSQAPVTWTFRGKNTFRGKKFKNVTNYLIFHPVEHDNAGEYICSGKFYSHRYSKVVSILDVVVRIDEQ